MSFNTFGKYSGSLLGESHGPAIGCVIDGCPPNIRLTEKDIQTDLDRKTWSIKVHYSEKRAR